MSDEKRNLPTFAELTKDKELAKNTDEFNWLLSQNPPEKWVKYQEYGGYYYMPIEVYEYLLKRIFKNYRVEITGQGQSFNGVWVTVRLHFNHPVSGEWSYHDGIGAQEIQTESGASPADMRAIKTAALEKAYPAAKSRAVKNACMNFGKFFGSDLNRDVEIQFMPDKNLQDKEALEDEDWQMVKEAVKMGKENGGMSAAKANNLYDLTADQKSELYDIEEGNDE